MLLEVAIICRAFSHREECIRFFFDLGSFSEVWLTEIHCWARRNWCFEIRILNSVRRAIWKELYWTYISNVIKTWFVLSDKAFQLRKVDVFLVSSMRWYWGSRSDCSSIKFSKSAMSESLSWEIVSKETERLMSMMIFELLSFSDELRRQVSLRLRFAQLSLSIVRYESSRWRHWILIFANDAS